MTCSKQLLKGLLKSLARWGGDEFTILFTKLSGRDALLDAPLSKKPSNPLLFSKTIIYTSPPVLASPYIHKLEWMSIPCSKMQILPYIVLRVRGAIPIVFTQQQYLRPNPIPRRSIIPWIVLGRRMLAVLSASARFAFQVALLVLKFCYDGILLN